MSARKCPSCGASLGSTRGCPTCRRARSSEHHLEELAFQWLTDDAPAAASLPKEWLGSQESHERTEPLRQRAQGAAGPHEIQREPKQRRPVQQGIEGNKAAANAPKLGAAKPDRAPRTDAADTLRLKTAHPRTISPLRAALYGAALGLLTGLAAGTTWTANDYAHHVRRLYEMIQIQGKWLERETARRTALELRLAQLQAQQNTPTPQPQ